MYYLTKFCRICIRTGVKLLDIDTIDFDSVKLSEKLEISMRMVISRESLSTEICLQCIKKLRISYDLQIMCGKSTEILQGYLAELFSASPSTKITPNSFVNSELRVTVTSLTGNNDIHYVNKRKRITKEQRCSLLKKLLLSSKGHTKSDNKYPAITNATVNNNNKSKNPPGGLRNIIDFTKNYNFGYDINEEDTTSTPLNKLTTFSSNFFTNNFTEFRDTILYIIENKDTFSCDSDDDEDMFHKQSISDDNDNNIIINDKEIKFEEVIVEPDIKIKYEIDYEENSNDEDEYDDYNNCTSEPYNFSGKCKSEFDYRQQTPDCTNNSAAFAAYHQYFHSNNNNSSMQLLDKLVGTFGQTRRFSQHSVRCRTRANPYINPQLRQQFQMRSFKCDRCNRYFKSPGYLKAHSTKVHTS